MGKVRLALLLLVVIPGNAFGQEGDSAPTAGTTAVEIYDPSQSSGKYSCLKTTATTFNTQTLTLGTTQG